LPCELIVVLASNSDYNIYKESFPTSCRLWLHQGS